MHKFIEWAKIIFFSFMLLIFAGSILFILPGLFEENSDFHMSRSEITSTVFGYMVVITLLIFGLRRSLKNLKQEPANSAEEYPHILDADYESETYRHPGVEYFKMTQDGINELKKKSLRTSIPTLIFVVLFFVVTGNPITDTIQTDIYTVLIALPLFIIIYIWGINRGMKRIKEIFDSYCLTIEDTNITRTQHNTPTISIAKKDISEIIKNADGSFTIIGNSKINAIGVPGKIENAAKLEKLLGDIKPLTIKTRLPFVQKFRWLISAITISLMAVIYVVENKIIVAVSGTILLAMMGYSLVQIQRSKNIDNSTRNGMLIVLIVMAAIGYMIYLKLTT